MICPDCGSEILKGHRICSVCGYEMTQEEWNQAKQDEKKGNGLRVVAVIVVIALIAGIGAAAFMLFRKRGDGPQKVLPTPVVVESTPTPWISPIPTPVPTSTLWATPVPTAAPWGDDRITSRRDAIRIAMEAREQGITDLKLQEMTLPKEELWDAIGSVAGYEGGQYWSNNAGFELQLKWRAGIRIWSAMQHGTLYELSQEDQRMAALAQETVDGLIEPWMTDLEKEIAIHDYIIYNADYAIEPSLNTESLYGFFNHGKVQCSGYSDTFYLLGRMAGLEITSVSGTVLENGESHEWNLIRLDGLWYAVDVTWDDPVGVENGENRYYLNFPHEMLRGLRTWEEYTLPIGAHATVLDGRWYYSALPYAWDVDEGVRVATSLIDSGQDALFLVEDLDMVGQISKGLAEHYSRRSWYRSYHQLPDLIVAEFWLE